MQASTQMLSLFLVAAAAIMVMMITQWAEEKITILVEKRINRSIYSDKIFGEPFLHRVLTNSMGKKCSWAAPPGFYSGKYKMLQFYSGGKLANMLHKYYTTTLKMRAIANVFYTQAFFLKKRM